MSANERLYDLNLSPKAIGKLTAMSEAALQPLPKEIRIVKPQQSVIIPSRKEAALKRVNDIETELGRMMRLLTELRADILSLTIE